MTATTAFRLSLDPELERFRPEIDYAVAFIGNCHFLRCDPQAELVVHYGFEPKRGALFVPAVLFPDGVTLDDEGIHPCLDALSGIEEGNGRARLLPPQKGGPVHDGKLAYDALGLIFHQLSRIEERNSDQLDRYERFSIEQALACRIGALLDPLADRAAFDFAALVTGSRNPANRTTYDLLLTHDIDRLRGYHRAYQPLRYALGDLLKRRQPHSAWRRLSLGYISGEPWTSVREIMDLSERIGRQSHFYFMGPTRLSNDSPYVHTMPRLTRRVATEIRQRGHVVGFHPGYATATDAKEWSRQRQGLQACIGMEVTEGRQHALRYQIDTTPDIWNGESMALDCTLSFPEASGFRSGTCRPHQGFSLRHRTPLDLMQIDTAIMDFGLFSGKYRELTIDEALAECRRAADVCRRYGGTLCILYHTGQPFAPQRPFYRRLLEVVN